MFDFPSESYSARIGFIEGIYSVLSESPRFTRVVLTDTITAWFFNNREVHWDDLKKVCNHDTTNTILLLTKASSAEQQSLNASYPESLLFHLIIETRWQFFNPETQQTLLRYQCTDTILAPIGYEFDKENLSHYINYVTGETCGKRLVPYWKDVERVIYKRPGKDLRDAADFVEINKWRNAGLLWNDLVDHRKARISSRAAFNLAVAFEREDDLDQAYAWLRYADSLYHTPLNALYLNALEHRIKIRILIDHQMEGR